MEEADLKEDREIIGLVCREDRKGEHDLRLNLINLGERKTLVMRILPIASRQTLRWNWTKKTRTSLA